MGASRRPLAELSRAHSAVGTSWSHSNHPSDIFSNVQDFSLQLQQLLSNVSAETDLRVSDKIEDVQFLRIDGSAPDAGLSWHQDHESYYARQDHYNYLNVHVIVEKSRPSFGNLMVVPFDVLEEKSPQLHKLTAGHGATKFMNWGRGKAMLMVDDNSDRAHLVDFHLDNVSCTPYLDVGDVLVMRGDSLHQTGPFERTDSRSSIFKLQRY